MAKSKKQKPIVIYVDDPFAERGNPFRLPSNWVHVLFENGEEMNVASQDGLSHAEAMEYAEQWSGYKGYGEVVAVIYKDNRDNEITRYRVRG